MSAFGKCTRCPRTAAFGRLRHIVNGSFRPRLMEWSPLSDTASRCHSGAASQPLKERSDRDEDYNCRCGHRKDGLPGTWGGRTGSARAQEAAQARPGSEVVREPDAVRDRNGSVSRGASLGAAAAEARAYGKTYGTTICEAVRQ